MSTRKPVLTIYFIFSKRTVEIVDIILTDLRSNINMLYALVFRPKIDTSKIDGFRLKYDPQANLIESHITLVFPISDKSIDKMTLEQHIKNVLKNEKSFRIHLQGLEKSWDHWLNLVIKEGNNDVIKLHDKLYSDILAPFFRKDLGYIPHVGIGLFISENSDYINRIPLSEYNQI